MVAFGDPKGDFKRLRKTPVAFTSSHFAIEYVNKNSASWFSDKDLLETMFPENNKDNCIFLLRDNQKIIGYFYKSIYIENDKIYYSEPDDKEKIKYYDTKKDLFLYSDAFFYFLVSIEKTNGKHKKYIHRIFELGGGKDCISIARVQNLMVSPSSKKTRRRMTKEEYSFFINGLREFYKNSNP